MTTDQSETWYLLWCLECSPPADAGVLPRAEIPFSSAAARGRWASEHTQGTGHDRWHVIDQPKETDRGH